MRRLLVLNLRRNSDQVRKATERIEPDQRHPRHNQRRIVRPTAPPIGASERMFPAASG